MQSSIISPDEGERHALPASAFLATILFVASLTSACAPMSPRAGVALPESRTQQEMRTPQELRAQIEAVDGAKSQNSELILRSLGLLGIDYKWGGNTPQEGMDCSGFVRYVFRDALGLNLPRRSEEISAYGDPVERGHLIPGDLVFFNTMGRPFSHVGLYIGNQQFIHAPSTGNVIRVESIRVNYWARRYDSARRISAANASAGPDNDGLQRLVVSRSAVAASSLEDKAVKPKSVPKPANQVGNPSALSPSYLASRAAIGSYSNH